MQHHCGCSLCKGATAYIRLIAPTIGKPVAVQMSEIQCLKHKTVLSVKRLCDNLPADERQELQRLLGAALEHVQKAGSKASARNHLDTVGLFPSDGAAIGCHKAI